MTKDKRGRPILNKTDIVIIGAGPTGLTLAHLLGQRGHNVLVLERETEFYGRARAVYTDDECMRILQGAGLAEDLSKDMIKDIPVQWLLPNGKILTQTEKLDSPFGWPVMNFLYQPWLETKMETHLSRFPNVTLLRGRDVTGFEQDETGVTINHSAANGSDVKTVRAKWLVGCDGGRSETRKNLNISMAGSRFPERWLVIDLKVENAKETLRHLPYFSFVCDPKQPIVCCPQPANFHRFEFQLSDKDTAEEMDSEENIRRLLLRFVDPENVQILRSLVYTFNALNAIEWSKGRVILAGDAAHMTPQFMGQGMSSGIRDAANLAWKLDLLVRGKADRRLLDSYQSERRPHAQAMIDISIMMMNFVSVRNPVLARLRNGLIRTLLVVPGLRGYITRAGVKPGPDFAKGAFWGLKRKTRRSAEGRFLPQPVVRDDDGRTDLMDRHLGDQFAFVGLGCDPFAHLSTQAKEDWNEIGVQSVTLWPYGGRPQAIRSLPGKSCATTEIEDINGHFYNWARRSGIAQNTVLIVRPDKAVAAVVQCSALENTCAKLVSELGQPERVI